jgi:predicted DNA-binding ribbon-helix-helix protein
MSKRSIVIAGHKTSVSLEDAFWKSFWEIARDRDLTVSEMATAIDSERAHPNLSSAIRLFVLDHYRSQIVAATAQPPIQREKYGVPRESAPLDSGSASGRR